MKCSSIVVVALLIGRVFSCETVSAAPVVDQELIPTTGTTLEASVQPLADGPSYGQTFTVGVSGRLAGADLALDAVFLGRSLNDVLVEVTTTLGGFPTSNVVASGTIAGTNIPVWNGLLTHVDFSLGPSVSDGQQLALLFFGEVPWRSIRIFCFRILRRTFIWAVKL